MDFLEHGSTAWEKAWKKLFAVIGGEKQADGWQYMHSDEQGHHFRIRAGIGINSINENNCWIRV